MEKEAGRKRTKEEEEEEEEILMEKVAPSSSFSFPPPSSCLLLHPIESHPSDGVSVKHDLSRWFLLFPLGS